MRTQSYYVAAGFLALFGVSRNLLGGLRLDGEGQVSVAAQILVSSPVMDAPRV